MQRLVGVWIGRSEKRVPPVLPSNCNQDPFETRVANQSRQGCQVRYVDPKALQRGQFGQGLYAWQDDVILFSTKTMCS